VNDRLLLREMEKPEKIYLNNPNLYHAIAEGRAPDKGALRETFHLAMLRTGHHMSVPVKGDFLVDEEITLEVGGKGKDGGQLRNLENA
jgi:predicted AAA+ superfamily ATPase